jgi:proteasome accessory factor C
MLVAVPYLVQHPGTTLQEAATLFGVEPRQLRRDLELLFMSGLPPYGPGDLIDVDIDEDGRIRIGMADHFARPIRLTRQEALAVYLRATELLSTPGIPEAPALASALDKLRTSLGSETLGDAGGIQATGGGSGPTHLDALRDAVANEVRVRNG